MIDELLEKLPDFRGRYQEHGQEHEGFGLVPRVLLRSWTRVLIRPKSAARVPGA